MAWAGAPKHQWGNKMAEEEKVTLSKNIDALAQRVGSVLKAVIAAATNTTTLATATAQALQAVTPRTVATVPTPIESGTQVELPNTYIVGTHRLSFFIDGVRCEQGDTFSEVGTAGTASNIFLVNDDIPEGCSAVVVIN